MNRLGDSAAAGVLQLMREVAWAETQSASA